MKTNIFSQLAVLLGVCFIGELVAQVLPIPFPAGVISMVILIVLLFSKLLKLKHIAEVGDFLLKNIAFFFIPAGVSIIEHIPIIRPVIVPFLIICIVSTFVTFAATILSVRLTSYLVAKASKKK